MLWGSQAARQLTVNQPIAGSNPALTAKFKEKDENTNSTCFPVIHNSNI